MRSKIITKFLFYQSIFYALIFSAHNVMAQYTSSSTTFGNDSIKITYFSGGKEKVINEPHKIPIGCFPITEAKTGTKSKNPNDKVTMSTLNYRLLDSLVWVECNKYRHEKNLQAVRWNDTIYRASVHHSKYQAYFYIVGHGETDSLPGSAMEQKHYNIIRVSAAEICLMRSYTDGESTYKELAAIIIDQWKHSPGHNAIMITPAYKLNAFASAFRYDLLTLLTRENLLKYNPELLKRIETEIPDYFKYRGHDNKPSFSLWCTGNFFESNNVKKEKDFVEHATVVHNKDGSTTYTYTSGSIPATRDVKKKPPVKKKKKKWYEFW